MDELIEKLEGIEDIEIAYGIHMHIYIKKPTYKMIYFNKMTQLKNYYEMIVYNIENNIRTRGQPDIIYTRTIDEIKATIEEIKL